MMKRTFCPAIPDSPSWVFGRATVLPSGDGDC
jgi:hypothetical protein